MSNRLSFLLGPAAMAAGLLAACGGAGADPGGRTRITDGPGGPSGVYIVGFSDSSSPGEPVYGAFSGGPSDPALQAGGDWPSGRRGVLWTDGVPGALGCDGSYAEPVSVSVSDGGDVYVAGVDVKYEEPGRYTYSAALWKNGHRARLGGPQSYAKQVFAAGDDVYVAGYQQCYVPMEAGETQYWAHSTVAKLWKNGQEEDLSRMAAYRHEEAHSVFVSGGDVYAAGFQQDDSGPHPRTVHAKLWKNGEGALLDDGKNETYAVSVHVRGDDVYVAGYEKIFANEMAYSTRAVLWKNGGRLALGGGGYSSEATSLFVSDEGDVYVAGRLVGDDYYGRAVIWKNGEAGALDFPTHPSHVIGVNSVFVSGGVVYAVGGALVFGSGPEFSVGAAAVLWRDGAAEVLDSGGAAHSGASSVFVRE
jgi:hypothetical protein